MQPYIYFDTSVWLKLYIAEDGSERTRGMAEKHRLVSSSILLTESLSALKRRHVNRELSKAVFGKLAKQVTADTQKIDTMPISDLHLRRAEAIVMETASGTLDALHIAAALLFQEMTGLHVPFVTADRRQAESARVMGLEVIFVNIGSGTE